VVEEELEVLVDQVVEEVNSLVDQEALVVGANPFPEGQAVAVKRTEEVVIQKVEEASCLVELAFLIAGEAWASDLGVALHNLLGNLAFVHSS
jgi:hypothetical protein